MLSVLSTPGDHIFRELKVLRALYVLKVLWTPLSSVSRVMGVVSVESVVYVEQTSPARLVLLSACDCKMQEESPINCW